MIGLLPELDFRQLAVKPAIADNPMMRGRDTSKISGLRAAGDGGKCRNDFRESSTFAKRTDSRGVRAYQRFSESDDVDDGGAMHPRL